MRIFLMLVTADLCSQLANRYRCHRRRKKLYPRTHARIYTRQPHQYTQAWSTECLYQVSAKVGVAALVELHESPCCLFQPRNRKYYDIHLYRLVALVNCQTYHM